MAHARRFRFGVTAHQAGSGAEWKALSRKVEDLGFSTLFVCDHLGDQLAPVPALAAAAEATTDLRVGVLVACNDFRHPVIQAKEVATLDVLSGGRAEWGVGAGWLAPEYEAAGLAFDPGPVRVDRMQEAVAVMKALLGDGVVTHEGRHYRVTNLDGRPKPVQRPHPPLLIGGARKRVLRFAGQRGRHRRCGAGSEHRPVRDQQRRRGSRVGGRPSARVAPGRRRQPLRRPRTQHGRLPGHRHQRPRATSGEAGRPDEARALRGAYGAARMDRDGCADLRLARGTQAALGRFVLGCPSEQALDAVAPVAARLASR